MLVPRLPALWSDKVQSLSVLALVACRNFGGMSWLLVACRDFWWHVATCSASAFACSWLSNLFFSCGISVGGGFTCSFSVLVSADVCDPYPLDCIWGINDRYDQLMGPPVADGWKIQTACWIWKKCWIKLQWHLCSSRLQSDFSRDSFCIFLPLTVARCFDHRLYSEPGTSRPVVLGVLLI